MDVDEVRCEISSMMDTLQKQLDYLDEVFAMEERRIKEQQNCWCKFMNRIFKRY
tara:strand:+ start:1004 stop:1165 length:162 start_codon:yes stop_codon:yes gene_type:complete